MSKETRRHTLLSWVLHELLPAHKQWAGLVSHMRCVCCNFSAVFKSRRRRRGVCRVPQVPRRGWRGVCMWCVRVLLLALVNAAIWLAGLHSILAPEGKIYWSLKWRILVIFWKKWACLLCRSARLPDTLVVKKCSHWRFCWRVAWKPLN